MVACPREGKRFVGMAVEGIHRMGGLRVDQGKRLMELNNRGVESRLCVRGKKTVGWVKRWNTWKMIFFGLSLNFMGRKIQNTCFGFGGCVCVCVCVW